MNLTRVGKMEIINNQMLRMVLPMHKSSNLLYARALLQWTTLEESMFMKMVVLFQKFKNLRHDHELSSVVKNVQLIDYWRKFSLTTRRIIDKFQNLIPWGLDYLTSDQLKRRLKELFI